MNDGVGGRNGAMSGSNMCSAGGLESPDDTGARTCANASNGGGRHEPDAGTAQSSEGMTTTGDDEFFGEVL